MTIERAVSEKDVDVWETRDFGLTGEESEAKFAFRDWLRVCGSKLAAYLADVNVKAKPVKFERSDVSELERLIYQQSGGREEALLALTMLGKVVYQLNRVDQRGIPQPQLADMLRREPHPLLHCSSLPNESVKAWLECEDRWISHLSTLRNPGRKGGGMDVPPELIVFRAVLHCGILDEDLAVAVYQAALDPAQNFHATEQKVYADLIIDWDGENNREFRRWYPDDELIVLLSRVAKLKRRKQTHNERWETRRQIAKRIHRAIVDEMRRQQEQEQINFVREWIPKDLKTLFARVEAVLVPEIPSVFRGYFTGKIPCPSLAASCIGRIYGDPAILKERVESAKQDIEIDDSAGYEWGSFVGSETPWYSELRRAFASGEREKIRLAVAALATKLVAEGIPTAHDICTLAISLLQGSASSGHKWKLPSIKCCVLTVARRVGQRVGNADIAIFTREQFEELFTRVIAEAAQDSEVPRRLQRTVAWALREFHVHLVATREAATLNHAEVFQIGDGPEPVDARIISIEDLVAALDYLEVKKTAGNEMTINVVQAEAIVAWCGSTRRMEGLGLRSTDYLGGIRSPILIRDNDHRWLKTDNSTRVVPSALFDLAGIGLVGFVNNWCRFERIDERHWYVPNEAPLFEETDENRVIPVLHDALKAVTGDSVHTHTLRKSLATWAFMRLMLAELPAEVVPDLFPHLPSTTEYLRLSRAFSAQLYGNPLLTKSDHAWAAAVLIGNGSPRTTLGTYICCLDILGPLFLKQSKTFGEAGKNDTTLDERLRVASGFAHSRAYDLLPAAPQNLAQRLAADRRRAFAVARFRGKFKDGAPVVPDPAPSYSAVQGGVEVA